MTRTFLVAASLLGVAVLFCSCGKSADSLASKNAKLFESDPQLKANWATASAALKTNGFATSIMALKTMQLAKLTPEQLQAVNDTVTAVNDKMYELANKGDAAAAKSIQDLRTSIRR
jgi:hypothetical protein